VSADIPVVGHQILCTLDKVLLDRGMTLTELSERVGVTLANLSILKNNRAKAIRFSTLTAICVALDCDVADLIRFEKS
jgi:putative transcriptional regulator